MKVCLVGCSHQSFSDHYKFCPYCGTRLIAEEARAKMQQLEVDIKEEIEKIMVEMECSKDFICYRSGFEVLCKAKITGAEPLLECLKGSPQDCEFSTRFGNSHFCQCPLRVYLAKELKK